MTSRPDFGATTNGTEVAEYFAEEIKGRNVVITGVSPRSLGGTLALTIARHRPYDLVLASQSRSELQKVQKELHQSTGVLARLVVLDLSSQASVRDAAARIAGVMTHVDLLINNAGLVSSERKTTSEGLELQFAVNHIGHFLLTNLLMPKLLASGTPRVVNVSSLGYEISPIRFHDYNFEGKVIPPDEEPLPGFPLIFTPNAAEGRPYHAFCAYGQSKTANILHAISLNEKFASMKLRAYAVHPGTIDTDLSRNLTPADLAFVESTARNGVWKTHDQGIATTLVAALDPALATPHDKIFLSDCQFEDPKDHANDIEIADRLWQLSESLVGGDQARL
ncbi:uncharacterized protein MYCFIDRAFT_59350 [Pseudocercospora fijiensis CIRAD86]|uniref:Uncharacterized protein n=1 Tax=Pseudocercospora fijiensis (strain CIRAD86) TaxID=383855 RepID=M3A4U9_PSEFD|nr:uncharacterized protein MYCFIDRAFT_59350 [Pseudocercospora fijiensis CIRAD86]EME86149.1 hypothetical protein MYCFIDRAFT_59350 [Pseudocercospora fijiensis CIRAD86]